MKNISYLTISIILFVTVLVTACQTDTATKKTTVDQPGANMAGNADLSKDITSADDYKEPEVKQNDTEETSDGSLATPTEAYKTAFAARQNKDVKALKKVLSKDILEFFTEIGKEEQKTLDEALEQLANKKQAAKVEVKNEKINGDKATLEYKDENGNWQTMDFVKETEGWKLTLPDMQSPPGEKTK